MLGSLGHAYIPYFWIVATVPFGIFALWAIKWQKRQEIELDRLELGLDGEVLVGEFLNSAGAENGVLPLLNLACYFLDRQVERLAQDFEQEGGFTERLYRVRSEKRKKRDVNADFKD